MITQEERPGRFSEVAGQSLVKKVLRSVVQNPRESPRSLIFEGSWGTGKTSVSRIFSRALNCVSPARGYEPCGNCEACRIPVGISPFYQEYDAAVVGNVETVRDLRDTFFVSMGGGYRVICFDECHLASSQSQNALLKALEECPLGIFFVFCTTAGEKIIPTIRSRSLELRFEPVPQAEVFDNLGKICEKRGKSPSETALSLIALRSRGHMRDAHIMLDNLLRIGEEDFIQTVRFSGDDFLSLFTAMGKGDKEGLFSALSRLLTYPLATLRVDFERACLSMTKAFVLREGDSHGLAAQAFGADFFKFIRYATSEWVLSSFESDVRFQTVVLALFQMLRGGDGTPSASPSPLSSARMQRR